MWHQTNDDGTVSLTFEQLSPNAMAVDYVGPHAVDPPGQMLKSDFDKWSWEMCTSGGFHERLTAYRQPGLPNVEEIQLDAPSTQELPDMSSSLEIADGALAVRLNNITSIPASSITVEFQYVNDAPQPFAGSSVQSSEVGGSLTFVGPVHGTIPSDQGGLIYTFPSPALSMLKSRVASSSSDSYFVAICHGNTEIGRIDGATLGEFVESKLSQ